MFCKVLRQIGSSGGIGLEMSLTLAQRISYLCNSTKYRQAADATNQITKEKEIGKTLPIKVLQLDVTDD